MVKTHQNHHKSGLSIASGSLVGVTTLAGFMLGMPFASAADNATVTVSVTVPSACSVTSSGNVAGNVNPGASSDIGNTTIKTLCNDASGYALYAVGYTGDTIGGTNSTKLTASAGSIATGTATSGSTSNWAMRAEQAGSSYKPTIVTEYATAHAVPSAYAKISSFTGVTDQSTGSSTKVTFSAFIATTQAAATYTGKVKFTIVHPATASAPTS